MAFRIKFTFILLAGIEFLFNHYHFSPNLMQFQSTGDWVLTDILFVISFSCIGTDMAMIRRGWDRADFHHPCLVFSQRIFNNFIYLLIILVLFTAIFQINPQHFIRQKIIKAATMANINYLVSALFWVAVPKNYPVKDIHVKYGLAQMVMEYFKSIVISR